MLHLAKALSGFGIYPREAVFQLRGVRMVTDFWSLQLSLDTTTSSNATITTAVLEPDGLRRASQRQSKWDVQPFACASASGGKSAEATAAELMWPPFRHDHSR